VERTGKSSPPFTTTLGSMERRRFLVALIGVMPLYGCPGIPLVERAMSTEDQRKQRFEAYWNSRIGRRLVEDKYLEPVVLSQTRREDNTTALLLTQHQNNCRITVVRGTQDSIVRSWSYSSEPKDCWEYVHTAP
jgi:hypothetical protein